MDPEAARMLLADAELADRLAESERAEQLAVLGTFDPRRLADRDDDLAVLKLLCRRLPARDDRQEAILFDWHRVNALARMLKRGGKAELSRVRRSLVPEYDGPLQRMLDAFVLDIEAPVERRNEDELLASLSVWRWATEAVARAHRSRELKIEPTRDEIESRLARLDVTRAVRKLASGGCIGRDEELGELHAYRNAPVTGRSLAEEPAMVVYGIGGVGKSTLVACFVVDLLEDVERGEPRAWAYLDLDRPSLSSYSADVVLADIVRQVAAQFPKQRRLLERSEVVVKQRGLGAGLEAADTAMSYRERAHDFGRDLQSFTDGSLVVVLDTFEELERKRPGKADELHDLFAGLASELPAFKLIVSGRNPAATFARHRRLHIKPLDDEDALHLLRVFVEREGAKAERSTPQLGDEIGREIIALVDGIPLTLRLAARVVVEEGPSAITDAAARAYALDRVRSEFVRGFLYQRILDHITAPDPAETDELRQVARASIALRQVTPELVEQVLVPSINPPPKTTASTLFKHLELEVALSERDGGVLRLREELRGPALAALRFEDPELVQRVHERAADYYAASPADESVLLELTYHRLAKGDPAATVAADVDETVLRMLEPALGELSHSSASVIRRAMKDRSELIRSRELDEWESGVLADSALRSGDLSRARAMLDQRPERSAGSELYRLESRLEEAEGNLEAAAHLARRDLDAARSAADPTRYAAAAVRLAALDEQLGRASEADLALQYAAEANLLAGYLELRLELLLNRLNTRERGRLESDRSRWSLGLDARALLQRINPEHVAGNTALLRLLAAALGREEPERIREAVRKIGLGAEEDPLRVQALVRALAAWDTTQPEPGRLARLFGLRINPNVPDAVERAWTSGVAGLGTQAGLLLDRLWTLGEPLPEPVREAIRLIYLWWGVKYAPPERSAAGAKPHFLEEVPLDWSRKEMHELEDLVVTAYPTSIELQALADRAGVDLAAISWRTSVVRIIRELLGTASRALKLPDLVSAILEDPSVISIHDPLRALVGEDWLRAHGRTP